MRTNAQIDELHKALSPASAVTLHHTLAASIKTQQVCFHSINCSFAAVHNLGHSALAVMAPGKQSVYMLA